jgi:hypothetical protein
LAGEGSDAAYTKRDVSPAKAGMTPGKVHPTPDVMPAKADIQLFFGVKRVAWRWIPAFAGMTQ